MSILVVVTVKEEVIVVIGKIRNSKNIETVIEVVQENVFVVRLKINVLKVVLT